MKFSIMDYVKHIAILALGLYIIFFILDMLGATKYLVNPAQAVGATAARSASLG